MLCEGGGGGIESTAVTPSQETEKIKESPEKPKEADSSPEKTPEAKKAEASPEKTPEAKKAEASPEKPPEIKEVQASTENTEVVEAAEITKELDDATHDGEVAADKAIDLLGSETLETAFVEAVPAKEEVSATPITLPKEDPDGIKDPNEADKKAAGEVQSVAAEVTAIPAITLEGAGEEGQVTIERAAVEPVERDDGELKMAIPDKDGGDDIFSPDEVYEQAGDLHEPPQTNIITEEDVEGFDDAGPGEAHVGPGDEEELGRGGGKLPLGAELLSSLSDIESQLAVSDSAKNQQAAAVLQEQVISSEGPADYYALASKAVEAQYGELPQTDSDALVGVVLGQTASAIDADIASLTDKIGDDALQQNADLQNMILSQQQFIQALSNVSKILHDTALAIIRKAG